ncbi:MAG: hypothetical protein O7G30_01165 [Proteobacteria bacterium]|nr:hypothetical protein [Pseudomonadota bacterium]
MSGRTGLTAALFLGLGLAACAALQWQPLGPRRTAAIENAQPVGAEDCLTCHEQVQGHAKIAGYHADCETCHGSGSVHGETEEPADIRYPSNGDCLACHEAGWNTHLQWGTGEHSRAGVFCSDCHNPHDVTKRHLRSHTLAGFERVDAASRLCLECHADTASQIRFQSHHPIWEGAMSCLSCHDPHEDSQVRHGTRNQRCAGCHQDTMGPWIFEHPPVVDGCVVCHNPHGAVGENLLETIQPTICLSCHPLNDMWHHDPAGSAILDNTTISGDFPQTNTERIIRQEAKLFLRRCTDCHGAIHGSYTDEHLRH